MRLHLQEQIRGDCERVDAQVCNLNAPMLGRSRLEKTDPARDEREENEVGNDTTKYIEEE